MQAASLFVDLRHSLIDRCGRFRQQPFDMGGERTSRIAV